MSSRWWASATASGLRILGLVEVETGAGGVGGEGGAGVSSTGGAGSGT